MYRVFDAYFNAFYIQSFGLHGLFWSQYRLHVITVLLQYTYAYIHHSTACFWNTNHVFVLIRTAGALKPMAPEVAHFPCVVINYDVTIGNESLCNYVPRNTLCVIEAGWKIRKMWWVTFFAVVGEKKMSLTMEDQSVNNHQVSFWFKRKSIWREKLVKERLRARQRINANLKPNSKSQLLGCKM